MKYKFTYWDNSQTTWVYPPKPPKMQGYAQPLLVFSCISESILKADKLFEHALNSGKVILISKKKKPKSFKVSGLAQIGCRFEKATLWEKIVDCFHGM